MVLLEADWIIPITGPPLRDGAVLVGGGVIRAVGSSTELRSQHPQEPVESFPGCVLMPGLVNAHTHLEYSAFRDFTRARSFGAWMGRLLLTRRKLGGDDFAASALWGAYECVRSGVTSVADITYEGWVVGRAAGAVGLRARAYLEIFGLDDARLPQVMDQLEARLAGIRGATKSGHKIGSGGLWSNDGRVGEDAGSGGAGVSGPDVEVGVSPHAPYTVSSRLYREAARFARRTGLGIATHVAESQAEVDLLMGGRSAIARAYQAAGLWGGRSWSPPRVSPVRYLADAGALGRQTLVVHAVQVDEDDIATLARSGAAVVHCPRSNMRLACGAAPVAQMMAAGIPLGLGTDSLASNQDLDMFAEMRAALQLSAGRAAGAARPRSFLGPGPQRERPQAGTALTPSVVLRMATIGGAQALGWDHLVGSLEVGKRADIIALALPVISGAQEGKGASRSASADPSEDVVAFATADAVRMTMVDGRVVFKGGDIPAEVRRAFGRARAKLELRG